MIYYSPEITINIPVPTRKVKIACDTLNSVIRYTLDDTEPTEQSDIYTEPFDVTPPVTVKAKGFKVKNIPSDTASLDVTNPIPVTVPMALPDGSVLFYDRGESYGEYHIGDDGYPVRDDGAVDDGSGTSANWRYLICDKSDLDNGVLRWGPYGTSESLTNTAIGVGLPNTEAMIAKYGDDDTYWWKLIKEKRDSTGFDWFMPSKNELDMMYNNRTVITDQGGDSFSTDDYYWSSSENSSNYAWGQYLSDGYQYNDRKTRSNYCRLLRRV